MHITCERCGTVYALDDRLIPPAGAPVQCTRCGSVFTAKPPQAAAEAPTRKTMMLFPGQGAPGERPSAPAQRADPPSSSDRPTPRRPTPAQPSPSTPAPAASNPRPERGAANKTLLQFPAFTPPTGKAPEARNPVEPARRATPTQGAPAAPQSNVGHRTPGTPAIGANRQRVDAMAKTILGAPSFPVMAPPQATTPPVQPLAPPVPAMTPPLQPLPGLAVSDAGVDASFEESLRNRGRRARTVALVIAGMVVAIIAVALFLRSRVPSLPEAAVRAHGDAMTVMKRDDADNLRAAADQFETIAKKFPLYAPSYSDEVVALALLEADLREQIQVLDARYVKLDKERDSLDKKQATEDWRVRVEEKIQAMGKVKAEADPLKDKATQLSAQLNEMLKVALQKSAVEGRNDVTVRRAQAIYYAVKGDDRGEKFAEDYRISPDVLKSADDPDHLFADLGVAATTAYGHHTPEKVEKARKAAQAVLAKDPSMLRAQFCLAKIELGEKNFAAAKAAVDALLIKNPKHEAAKLLREEIDAGEAAARPPVQPAPQPAPTP